VTRRWLRPTLVAASILLYALLEHYTSTTGATTPGTAALGAALATTPLLLAWLLFARRLAPPRVSLPVALLAAAAVLMSCWRQIEHNFPLMFMLQEVGVYLMLAWGFGRSLLAGQVPLCTHWAGMLHGPLSAQVQRYTRSVTLAWTVFFVAISLSSALLFRFAPLRVWSVFSNFLTLPLAALMFAIEYALRRRRLPWMQHASLADTAHAYFATTRRGAAPRC
jgi:uncharacterized membrane protein